MNRTIRFLALAVLLTSICSGQGLKIGIGGFGGFNLPIAQEDQKTGTAFGFKARIKLLPFLVIEPNAIFGKWGAPDPVDGIDLGIDGSKITSFGVDATLGNLPGGVGVKPYGTIGAAMYGVKNGDTEYDESKLGFSFGLGIAYGFSEKVDADIRAKAVIAPQEEGSKKAIMITGGLNYYFSLGK